MIKSFKLKNDLTEYGDIYRLAAILSKNGFATHKIADALEKAARAWRFNAKVLESHWKSFGATDEQIKETIAKSSI